jgi:hypothetical protein
MRKKENLRRAKSARPRMVLTTWRQKLLEGDRERHLYLESLTRVMFFFWMRSEGSKTATGCMPSVMHELQKFVRFSS